MSIFKELEHSCAECGTGGCGVPSRGRPEFCTSDHIPPVVKEAAMAAYDEGDNRKIMQTAAQVEYEGYCRWPRVQEIVEFAKRMGYQRIGIATCNGLLKESGILARILRSHGFKVFGIACKAGMVPKTDMGIDEACTAVGCNMCNPILQAAMLNTQDTEFNVVMGLCVGHDSLFYKYAKAPCTTLVTKDRVTGHNPAAALYTSHTYYKGLMGPEEKK